MAQGDAMSADTDRRTREARLGRRAFVKLGVAGIGAAVGGSRVAGAGDVQTPDSAPRLGMTPKVNSRPEVGSGDPVQCGRSVTHAQRHSDLGVTDAGAQGAETPVDGAMGIRAHDQVARGDVPFLHEHEVRDAGVGVIEPFDTVRAREFTARALVGSVLLGSRRRKSRCGS